MNREKGWSPPRRLHDNLSQSPEGDFLDKYLHHPHVVVDSRGEDDDMVVYVAPIRSSEWREYEQRRKEWMDIATAGATRLCPSDAPRSLSPAAALSDNTRRNPHEILTPATYEAHPLRGSASPTFRNTDGGSQRMAATMPASPLPDERVVGDAAEDEEDAEEIQQIAQQLRVMRARIAALKGAQPHPPPQQHEDEVQQRLQDALLHHQLALESGERQRRERADSIQRSLSRGRPTASPEPRASPQNGALPAVVDRALRFDPASPPRIELVHGASDDRERRRVVNSSETAKPSTSGSWSLVKHMGRARIALPLLRQHATKAASAVEWSSFAFPLMVDAELPESPSETGGVAVTSASSEVEVVVVVPSADSGSDQTAVWRCFVQGPLQQQHEAQDDGGHGIRVTAPCAVWLTVELPGAPTAAAATSHSYQLAVATNDSQGTWRSQPAEITSFPLKGEGWLSVEVLAAGYRQWYRSSVEAAHSPRDAAVSPTARAQARRQRLTALLA